MGLTHTAGDEVRKKDITVAKNYLNEIEISNLNRVVTMWLDFAEDQAKRQKQIFLRDWQEKLEQFLTFNDREVLQGAGNISKKQVDEEDFYKQKSPHAAGIFYSGHLTSSQYSGKVQYK